MKNKGRGGKRLGAGAKRAKPDEAKTSITYSGYRSTKNEVDAKGLNVEEELQKALERLKEIDNE